MVSMRIAVLAAVLMLAACGGSSATQAHISSQPSAAPTPIASTPTSFPAPTPSLVRCTGAPGIALAVIADQFLYDVSKPADPRLVCRGANATIETSIHLLDGNAISYIAHVASQAVVVRHDLTTGAETLIAQLPAEPALWTADGSFEVYASPGVKASDGTIWAAIHLWSNGADHVLYRLAGPGGPRGYESRWNSPWQLAEFSPDRAYLAIQLMFDGLHIFSVADQREVLAPGTASAQGGAWVANDRFVWGSGSATSLMQWTPAGGAKLLRAGNWFGPRSSSDGRWLVATRLNDAWLPHVEILSVDTGPTFITGLGSSPGFVTPTVVWYVEERSSDGYDPTAPAGVYHAFDVANGSDQIFRFRVGEEPFAKIASDQPPGDFCCAPGS
jgi:hypothetical protein